MNTKLLPLAKLTALVTPLFLAGTLLAATPRPSTVLLISPDNLSDAWKPFADWKTRIGKPTTIITLNTISTEFEGNDIQQKIRACTLDHIANHGTRWVILGGDSTPGSDQGVPDRDTDHSGFFKYKDIPTDIYYISEQDWDADADGVYGEFPDDKEAIAYTNPRASIGRIPVRSPADVEAYTKKVIAYESNYPTDNFARNMIYTCPERGAYPKLNTSKETIEKDWGGSVRNFFAAQTPWDENKSGDHDLTPANWVEMINSKKIGKMHMHGHGFLPLWVLEGKTKLTSKQIGDLNNDNAYLAITTVSCFTGQYDSRKDPSITESMLRAPNAGAVLIIAPSREGIPVFHNPRRDMRLMVTEGKMDGTTETLTRFWHHALTRNESIGDTWLTAGDAFRAAKKDMTPHARITKGYHFVQCELNLLGDPTLDLRAAPAKAMKVKAPTSISTGKQTIRISAGNPDASVCLWKGDEVYLTAQTDANGDIELDIKPKTPGNLLLSVSGPSLNTHTATIKVK